MISGILLAQDRRVDAVERDGKHRVFLGGRPLKVVK